MAKKPTVDVLENIKTDENEYEIFDAKTVKLISRGNFIRIYRDGKISLAKGIIILLDLNIDSEGIVLMQNKSTKTKWKIGKRSLKDGGIVVQLVENNFRLNSKYLTNEITQSFGGCTKKSYVVGVNDDLEFVNAEI